MLPARSCRDCWLECVEPLGPVVPGQPNIELAKAGLELLLETRKESLNLRGGFDVSVNPNKIVVDGAALNDLGQMSGSGIGFSIPELFRPAAPWELGARR